MSGSAAGRWRLLSVVAITLALTGFSTGISPSWAADSATGSGGQRLTVSQDRNLNGAGQLITVTGAGYNPAKGIYLAFCVLPPAGQLPTPCGGGADTSGSTGSSVWISSHPPSYGKALAVPFGPGGSFRQSLHVSATLNDTTDCRKVRCAVVTRADHTRSEDRSQDVLVAVSFEKTGHSALWVAGWWGTGTLAVLLLVALGWWLWRRQQATRPALAGTPVGPVGNG